MYVCIYIYIYTHEELTNQISNTTPYNSWNQGCGDKLVYNNPPLRMETILQLSTLSEGVGGDMARDTYEMTSPMRAFSYVLGLQHIFHQPLQFGVSSHIAL